MWEHLELELKLKLKSELKLSNMYAYGKLITLFHYKCAAWHTLVYASTDCDCDGVNGFTDISVCLFVYLLT